VPRASRTRRYECQDSTRCLLAEYQGVGRHWVRPGRPGGEGGANAECTPSAGQCLTRIVAREGTLLQTVQLLLDQNDHLSQLGHPEIPRVER
jgi:hypothetical protein